MNKSMGQKSVMLVVSFDGVGMEQIFVHRIPVVKTINGENEYNYKECCSNHSLQI
jgi:hypothetical protein